MEKLELHWSRRKLVLYLAASIGAALYALIGNPEPWWQRLVIGAIGVAGVVYSGRRLASTSEPVLVLSQEGVWDSRLQPSFLPWQAVSSVSYEPKYFRGGAILLELTAGAPVPDVRNPPMITRGYEAAAKERSIRLTLGDLNFSPAAVRRALEAVQPEKRAV